MAGLHAGSLLVAVVCLVGAVAVLLVLPRRVRADRSDQPVADAHALEPVG